MIRDTFVQAMSDSIPFNPFEHVLRNNLCENKRLHK